jgi:hypothetical protein
MARGSCAATAIIVLCAVPAAPASAYTTRPAPYRDSVRFAVTYSGSGSWRTVYHSTPPNKGGAADTNDANDSSTQRWSLRYTSLVAVGPCTPDSCASPSGPAAARGTTQISGRVHHTHVDGLYRDLDMKMSCRLRMSTPRGERLHARVGLAYSAGRDKIAVTAYEPVGDALGLFPRACPHQGDSLDGLLDSYFDPGFSFVNGWGSERWFTSRTVQVPVGVFHRSAAIAIPLRASKAGTPPRRCAVQYRYERCVTGGAWHGVLKFTARP